MRKAENGGEGSNARNVENARRRGMWRRREIGGGGEWTEVTSGENGRDRRIEHMNFSLVQSICVFAFVI